jgi:hypothetical protein
MFIKFVQVYILPQFKGEQKYSLREVVINTEHVAEIKEDLMIEGILKTTPNQFPQGIANNQKFTILFMSSNKNITVVGDLDSTIQKINKTEKILLKG